MTEDEYINATNLAKVRSALAVMRQFISLDKAQEKTYRTAMKAMSEIEERLSKLVSVEACDE